MKLSAAARRGIRRDFWDLYVMFERGTPTLQQALDDYRRRYGVSESDLYHVLKALTYFADADAEALYPLGLTEGEVAGNQANGNHGRCTARAALTPDTGPWLRRVTFHGIASRPTARSSIHQCSVGAGVATG